MMELRHLQYFLKVAETGNVSKAAQQCFVAQSALSAQIARLEAEVGVRLFARSNRGMRLTPAGELFRPLAARILADVEHARDHMDSWRGLLRGRLRIGMIQGPPAAFDLVRLVATFHDRHPDVELIVRTAASADLAHAVADGELDLAVVAIRGGGVPAALRTVQLYDDPLVAVFSTSAAVPKRRKTIGLAELVALGPFIHYQRRSGLRASVDAAGERAGVGVTPRFELDQMADMIRLAALGVGVTVIPLSSATGNRAAQNGCRVLRLDDPQAVHTISAVTVDDPSPSAAQFLALLDECAQGCGADDR